MGAFAYADDIVILAPAKYALRVMLRMVNEFSRKYDIKFNLTKSEFVIFVANGKYEPTEKMEFDGLVLIAKEFVEHLENIIHIRSHAHVNENEKNVKF